MVTKEGGEIAATSIAQIVMLKTSERCVSVRLLAAGRIVFRTRAFDFGPACDEARRRGLAWAGKHGFTIVETERRRRA